MGDKVTFFVKGNYVKVDDGSKFGTTVCKCYTEDVANWVAGRLNERPRNIKVDTNATGIVSMEELDATVEASEAASAE